MRKFLVRVVAGLLVLEAVSVVFSRRASAEAGDAAYAPGDTIYAYVPEPSYVAAEAMDSVRTRFRPLAEMMATNPAQRPTSGNSFELIVDGRRKLELIKADLAGTKDYVLMEYFNLFFDTPSMEFIGDLRDRASNGLTVKYIHEDLMNFPMPWFYFGRRLKPYGIDVRNFSARGDFFVSAAKFNRRDHRKILIFDGRAGYTGGMNIGAHYFDEWKDTHLRMTGPGVEAMQDMFMSMWDEVGGRDFSRQMHVGQDYPLEYETTLSDEPVGEPDPSLVFEDKVVQVVTNGPGRGTKLFRDSYNMALDLSEDYFYIQSPYFVLPKSTLRSLKGAAERGVDVRVILPEKADIGVVTPVNRSFYRTCLRSGIRIFENKGAFDHTKLFVSDGYLSSVGSANLDPRSLKTNYEDNVYFYDSDVAGTCTDLFLSEQRQCEEVSLESTSSWGLWEYAKQFLCRLLSPVL